MAKKGKLTINRGIIPQKEELAKAELKRIEKDKEQQDLELTKTSTFISKELWMNFKIHCLKNDIQGDAFLNESIDNVLSLKDWRNKLVELEELNKDNRQLVVFRIENGKLRDFKVFCQMQNVTFRDVLESYIIGAL